MALAAYSTDEKSANQPAASKYAVRSDLRLGSADVDETS
jgi:hypothetical protein